MIERLCEEQYHGLLLTVNSKLYHFFWNSEDGKTEYEEVSQDAYSYLFEPCMLDKDLTLSDVYGLLSKNGTLQRVYSRHYIYEQLEEYRQWLHNVIPAKDTEVKELVLEWSLEASSGTTDYQQKVIDAVYRNDVSFLKRYIPDVELVGGKIILPSKVEEEDFDTWLSNPGRDNRLYVHAIKEIASGKPPKPHIVGMNRPDFYGLGIDPETGLETRYGFVGGLSDLFSLPLRLSDKLHIYPDLMENDTGKDLEKTYCGPHFSLGTILEGVLWETSFHGPPEKADAFKQKLMDAVEEVTNKTDTDPII